MEDNTKIIREWQRLSVNGFNENDLKSIHRKQISRSPSPLSPYTSINHRNNNNRKHRTFNKSVTSPISPNTQNSYNYNNDNHNGFSSPSVSNEPSISDIIHDLRLRREHRLQQKQSKGKPPLSQSSPSPPFTKSRFMQAHNHKLISQQQSINEYNTKMIEMNAQMNDYKSTMNEQNKNLKILNAKVGEQEEMIKALQYKLLQKNEYNHQFHNDDDDGDDGDDEDDAKHAPPKMGKHLRQKSVTQTQTENSTIENVRWELRSEISKMAGAQNEVERILKSVGDSSMIHGRLKKVHETISVHKRKVSALEQTLNVSDMYIDGGAMYGLGVVNSENDDFEELSKEYSKCKLEINELEQEKTEWNNTKLELKNVNKRCDTLGNMLDKMSDEKLNFRLRIDELQTLLSRHNIKYQ